jgi:hypothetical protein
VLGREVYRVLLLDVVLVRHSGGRLVVDEVVGDVVLDVEVDDDELRVVDDVVLVLDVVLSRHSGGRLVDDVVVDDVVLDELRVVLLLGVDEVVVGTELVATLGGSFQFVGKRDVFKGRVVDGVVVDGVKVGVIVAVESCRVGEIVVVDGAKVDVTVTVVVAYFVTTRGALVTEAESAPSAAIIQFLLISIKKMGNFLIFYSYCVINY